MIELSSLNKNKMELTAKKFIEQELKKRFGKDIEAHNQHYSGSEWIEKMEEYHQYKVKDSRLHGVRPSLLDNVKEIAFGDGSAQERMGEIKALFSNEA